MIDFNTISQTVQRERERKFDSVTKMSDVTPLIEQKSILLRTPERTASLTKRGLSSYLEKIKVPHGFFGRCSEELKQSILGEHHPKAAKSSVLLRFYDDSIRFVGSNKYGIFDDAEIMDELAQVDSLHSTLKIREFHQTVDNLVMRVTTNDPIVAPNGRPFYPGIQIMNSETGCASLSIQFLLWEQICTNGVTVPHGIMKSYTKRHLGNTDAEKLRLKVSTNEILQELPRFIDSSHRALQDLSKISDKDMIEQIEAESRVPKMIKEALPGILPNYTPANMKPTALDVLSAYTEAIQKYQWDTRNQLEDIAGEFLFA